MYVCETCINKCKNSIALKETFTKNIDSFVNNLKKKKRLSTTPPSALKMSITTSSPEVPEAPLPPDMFKAQVNDIEGCKPLENSFQTSPSTSRHRTSVAENILRSAEKLKGLSLNDKLPKKSRQRLNFQDDHGYSKGMCSIPASEQSVVSRSEDNDDNSAVLVESAEDFIRTKLKQVERHLELSSIIDSTVNRVSKLGKSVLYKKNPVELCTRNWFRDATSELYKECPELYAVLFAAIGGKVSAENKLATMAIIYGMILHSRNVKACAIQRIITTLCIRFHADNKIQVTMCVHHLMEMSAFTTTELSPCNTFP